MKRLTVAGLVIAVCAGVLAGNGAHASGDLRAGFAVRSIVPEPSMFGQVWHTERKRPTGVLPGDGIWARAVAVRDGERALAIVSLDLLGLFYDDVVAIRDRARAEVDPALEVIVASTHSHASIDTLGIYGPDQVTTGISPAYQALVRDRAFEAVADAWSSAVPAQVRVGSRPAPGGLNEYDINRHPGSFDDGVHVIQFVSDAGVVGTLVNWASHPELIDADSATDPGIPANVRGAVLSSDYVHTLRTTVEGATGAPVVFVNGPVGAVTALAMPIRDPDTGEVFPRRSVKKSYYVGARIGETALEAVAAVPPRAASLEHDSVVFHLRVDNPFLIALLAAGAIQRQTYAAGEPVPLGREVRTEMVRVRLGDAEFLTVPGELHPDVYTGGYLPREERANPDVPRERAIEPQLSAPVHFLIGLGMDELGYMLSATDFVRPSTVFPLYGRGVDRSGRSHYQETLSIGRDTARSIGQWASVLLGHEPEADYQPYAGGFLDAGGAPVYRIETAQDAMRVRGLWVDTSDSGRYERTRDAAVYTPLPSGAPAAFGFLDAYHQDLGATATSRARGVWIDGDGDGAFDHRRDPFLYFDSYHVGKGEIRP